MRYGFINNFGQTLAADLAAGATTMTLDGGGTSLSAASADLVYTLTLVEKDTDGVEVGWEIVYVTGASGNDLTITRGQEGTADAAWPSGTTVEMRVTAMATGQFYQRGAPQDAEGSNTVTIGNWAIAKGNRAMSLWGAECYGEESLAIGWVATIGAVNYAGSEDGAILGPDGASHGPANGSVAVGTRTEIEMGCYWSVAIGRNALVQSPQGVSIGNGATCWAPSPWSNPAGNVAVGAGASAYALDTTALGAGAYAEGEYTVSVGAGAWVVSARAVGIGRAADVGNYGDDSISIGDEVESGDSYSAQANRAITIGAKALGAADDSVTLGAGEAGTVVGGFRVGAISYLPTTYRSHANRAAASATNRASQQVVISTDALDLTSASAAVTLDLPAGTLLFIDSIDVVVTGSDTPGGAPEISVGPDDVTPSAYLAATVVGKTTVGGRETHSPIVTDGVTSLRVATTTAGTGTTYQAKVVFRGYVMEL